MRPPADRTVSEGSVPYEAIAWRARGKRVALATLSMLAQVIGRLRSG